MVSLLDGPSVSFYQLTFAEKVFKGSSFPAFFSLRRLKFVSFSPMTALAILICLLAASVEGSRKYSGTV